MFHSGVSMAVEMKADAKVTAQDVGCRLPWIVGFRMAAVFRAFLRSYLDLDSGCRNSELGQAEQTEDLFLWSGL